MGIEVGNDLSLNKPDEIIDHTTNPELYEKVFDIDFEKFEPVRGDIFRTRTVKGEHVHIVFLCRKDDWAVYAYGDRPMKMNFHDFMKRLQHGDGEFKGNIRDEDISDRFDVQRLTMLSIGLASLGKGESVDEHLDKLESEYEGKMKTVSVEEKGFDRGTTAKQIMQ